MSDKHKFDSFKNNLLEKFNNYGAIIIALAITCAGLVATYLKVQSSYPNELGLFFAFLGIVIAIEGSILKSTWTIGKQAREITELFNKTSYNIDRLNRFTVFKNSMEGFEYCIRTIPFATKVLNTVLCYGDSISDFSSDAGKKTYADWIEAKKNYLNKDTYSLKELVSSHLNPVDPERQFVSIYRDNNKYSHKFIDDATYPMMQLTIFEFNKKENKRDKEVIFGWEFPNMPNGYCFKTDNQDVVGFFEEYFQHYYAEKSQKYPSIVTINTPLDKCYNTMKSGVWLYILKHDDLNNVYGTIQITDTGDKTNINNKYKANASVWYMGGLKRGKWHSINFEYDPLTQYVHIQYDIQLENPSKAEKDKEIKEYTGYLHFRISNNINEALNGEFSDLAGGVKAGGIEIRPYLDKQDNILNHINESDLPKAFERLFDMDITQGKS